MKGRRGNCNWWNVEWNGIWNRIWNGTWNGIGILNEMYGRNVEKR